METIPQFMGMFMLNVLCSMTFCYLYILNRRKYKRIGAGDLAGKYKVSG